MRPGRVRRDVGPSNGAGFALGQLLRGSLGGVGAGERVAERIARVRERDADAEGQAIDVVLIRSTMPSASARVVNWLRT